MSTESETRAHVRYDISLHRHSISAGPRKKSTSVRLPYAAYFVPPDRRDSPIPGCDLDPERRRAAQCDCERAFTQGIRKGDVDTHLEWLHRIGKHHGFRSGVRERSIAALSTACLSVFASAARYGGAEGDANVVDCVASLRAVRRGEERSVEEIRQEHI